MLVRGTPHIFGSVTVTPMFRENEIAAFVCADAFGHVMPFQAYRIDPNVPIIEDRTAAMLAEMFLDIMRVQHRQPHVEGRRN